MYARLAAGEHPGSLPAPQERVTRSGHRRLDSVRVPHLTSVLSAIQSQKLPQSRSSLIGCMPEGRWQKNYAAWPNNATASFPPPPFPEAVSLRAPRNTQQVQQMLVQMCRNCSVFILFLSPTRIHTLANTDLFGVGRPFPNSDADLHPFGGGGVHGGGPRPAL